MTDSDSIILIAPRQQQLLSGIEADLHRWQTWTDEGSKLSRDQQAIASRRHRAALQDRCLRIDFPTWIGGDLTATDRRRCARDLAALERAGRIVRFNWWDERGRTTHIHVCDV